MAAKTLLEKGTSVMDPLKGLLLTYFMPESCYDTFFLDFNFLDGELAIRRTLKPSHVKRIGANIISYHTYNII